MRYRDTSLIVPVMTRGGGFMAGGSLKSFIRKAGKSLTKAGRYSVGVARRALRDPLVSDLARAVALNTLAKDITKDMDPVSAAVVQNLGSRVITADDPLKEAKRIARDSKKVANESIRQQVLASAAQLGTMSASEIAKARPDLSQPSQAILSDVVAKLSNGAGLFGTRQKRATVGRGVRYA